jgi:hypothetical protein
MNERMTEQLFRAFRKAIMEAVEVFRPDVILCHHLYFLTALVREMYPGIPVYGQCHGSDIRQFLKNPWQHEWILSQIPKLDGIFALHEEQKKQICFLFGIPEENIAVYSRCLIVRKDESGRIVDLEKDDLKKAEKYMVRMEEKRK